MIRIDLSPSDYIHVPQAPRIERRPILSRGPGNEWQMWGAYGVSESGERVGLSNHTWSHLDAPFHLLADGDSFERLDPARYLVLRTRIVDLTTGPERHETVDGVSYHTEIDVDDVPADLDDFDAVLFATGFSALYRRGYPMRPDADAHYPHIVEAAARRLAASPRLSVVAIDAPSVDKPTTNAAAHRILLGRTPTPVLLLETLTLDRLSRRFGETLPHSAVMTVEPLRALGSVRQDGCISSVYAYVAERGEESRLEQLYETLRSAEVVG